jgi:hypothetical protein
MGGRDDPVALTPDEECRHLLGQVEAIPGRDHLAAEVDDAADRAEERLPRLEVAEAGEAGGDFL